MANDADAALAFMAGLIGGYTGGREKKQDRKRRDQQDADDRAWREFQKQQAELDRQYREQEATYRRTDDATDDARAERQWSQERIDRMTDKEDTRNFQMQLEQMQAGREDKRYSEQQQYREEGRKDAQTQKELMGIAGEIDDLRMMYFNPEDGWLDPNAEARYSSLAQRRQEILSGGPDAAPGAKPASTQFDARIMDLADEMGVDPKLARAVMMAESGGNPNAVSSAGAQGLFQLMPGTAQEMGVADPFNPEQNAKGGIGYLAKLYKMTGGNLDQTLAAYNWGIGNVQKKGMGAMPKETQDYLPKVKGLMGASPADNSFVSNLAQGSGLAPKKRGMTASERKILERDLDLVNELILQANGQPAQDIVERKAKLVYALTTAHDPLIERYGPPPAPKPVVPQPVKPAVPQGPTLMENIHNNQSGNPLVDLGSVFNVGFKGLEGALSTLPTPKPPPDYYYEDASGKTVDPASIQPEILNQAVAQGSLVKKRTPNYPRFY